MKSSFRKLLFSAAALGSLMFWPVQADELELVLQSGHQRSVVDSLFLNENYLVSASSDGSLKLWDVASQRVRRTMWQPGRGDQSGGVVDLARSQEGVWAAYSGGHVVLWDVIDGKALREVTLPSDAHWYQYKIALDRDENLYAQGDYMYCIVRKDKPVEARKFESAINHFDVSRDGSTLTYSHSTGIIVERDGKSFEVPQSFANRWGVEGLMLDDDGQTLFISTSPGWLEGWNIKTQEFLFRTPFEDNPFSQETLSGQGWGGADFSVTLSAYDDTRILATERNSGKLFLVNRTNGDWSKLGSLNDPDITRVELNESRTALTAGHRQNPEVPLAVLKDGQIRVSRMGGEADFFSNVELSGNRLCLASTRAGIVVFDLNSGAPFRNFSAGYFPAIATKNGKLYCGGNDGVIYCYDVDSGRELWSRDLTTEGARFGYGAQDIAINPVADQIAVSVSQMRSQVVVLDGSTGKSLITLDSTESQQLLFSSDGRQLFISKGRNVQLYDMNYRKVLHTWTLPGKRTSYIAGMLNHPLEDSVLAIDQDGELLKFQRNRLDLAPESISQLRLGQVATVRPFGNNLLLGAGRRAHLVGPTGKVLTTYGEHLTGVSDAIAVGETVLSTGWDSMVGLWRQDDGQELARLYSLRTGKEWLVTSPDYHFDGSQEAQNLLEWRWNGELYQVSRFFEKFYEPGLLGRVIRGRTQAVSGAPNTRATLGSKPPSVALTQPKLLDSGEYEVEVKLEGADSGDEEVRLYHNGHRILGQNPFRFRAVQGRNILRASAFNTDKTIESEPERLVFHVDAKDEPSTLYVFAAAVNDYPNPLDFAVPDAKSFSEAFKPGLYEKVEKVVLLDKDATKQAIIEKLSTLPCRPQDTLLVFLAGHGTIIDNKFHYLPFGSTGSHSAEALSSQELGQLLAKLPATRQVLFLDTCHAGASAKDLAELLVEKDTPLTATAQGSQFIKDQKLLARQAGTFLVAGSTPNATAAEVPQLGHGIFTYAVLNGLTADVHGEEKEVTVNELLRYLNEKVPELSLKFRGSPMGIWQFSAGQDFPIAKP